MTTPNHSSVLITGATGFVGRALCEQLTFAGHAVIPAIRSRAGLLAVPVDVLELAGALLDKHEAVARLAGSIYVDGSLIRLRLGWTPPYSMEAGMAATVAALA